MDSQRGRGTTFMVRLPLTLAVTQVVVLSTGGNTYAVPSVLVELGYLSSKADEQRLSSDAWRKKTAAAMARAVDGYFSTEVAARAN